MIVAWMGMARPIRNTPLKNPSSLWPAPRTIA